MLAGKGHHRLAEASDKRQRRLEAVRQKYSILIRGVACALLALVPLVAGAQDSQNRVAAHTDWSVFEAKDHAQCWSVSSPKKTVNSRDGRVVEVRRGDILLFVSFIPESDVKGQVSFTGGYPFRDGSTVALDIGGTTFKLFPVAEMAEMTEMAWSSSDTEDAKIVAAMKRGAEARLTAFSTRGTKTEDTFSLLGFTAAMEEAAKRCSG